VDAAGWGILITLVPGVPTLWFAIRATRASEQTLSLEQRRDRESKRASLGFADSRRQGAVWQARGYWPNGASRSSVHFHTHVRNRGPAVARDIDWEVIAEGEKLRLGPQAPTQLFPHEEQHLDVFVPLELGGSPVSSPVRFNIAWVDDSGPRSEHSCFRFNDNGSPDPHTWTATELDCVSFEPKQGRP
jgi:hypothetical protein